MPLLEPACRPHELKHHYQAYGLVIGSALLLPELPALDGVVAPPDISITVGALPEVGPDQGPPESRRIGPFLWATPDEFWFCVPRIARFRITKGCEIIVDPEPSGDADGVRVFLLGTALGVVLAQRGHLMLHGNAVRIGDGCVVCVGPSGAGKSTLAAAFARRGFALLSDDLVMVDEACRVPPGIPRIKLWADMAHALQINTGSLERIRPNLEKFSYPIRDGFAPRPVQIRAMYSLATTNAGSVTVLPIEGFAKFREVRGNTYRPQFIDVMGMRERYLALCSKLATTVPVTRMARPEFGFSADLMIDRILEDLGSTP